jgi:hypothetical protein
LLQKSDAKRAAPSPAAPADLARDNRVYRALASCYAGSMTVEQFFSLRARIVDLARTVEADPTTIGPLSTGEACAVALLLGRLDLLADRKHPLDALERLGPEWEKTVRDLHRTGWRQ